MLRGIKAAVMTVLLMALPVAAAPLNEEPEQQKELAAELPSAAGVLEAAKENSAVINLPDRGLPPAGGEVLDLESSPELREFDNKNAGLPGRDYFAFYASLYGSMELMIRTQAALNVWASYDCNFKPYFHGFAPLYGNRELLGQIEKTSTYGRRIIAISPMSRKP